MCIRDSLIIGKWKMTSGNAVATHVTYKNDGTFEYTSTEDGSYNEVGKYKICLLYTSTMLLMMIWIGGIIQLQQRFNHLSLK